MTHTRASREATPSLRRGMRLSELLTVRDETDADGRLLLEDSAPKQARKKAVRSGIPMRSVPCNYSDTPSRDGGLMNVSAYEALRHETAGLLNGFAWLNQQYRALTESPPATVQGLVDVTNLGLSLPLMLFRRANDPVPLHGSLSPAVASMFKASRGVFSAAVDLLNQRGPADRTTNASEVVAFADQEGHLIRDQTRRACAAPTRLMERTIAVILTGEGANAGASGLDQLIAFPTLWEFYTLEHSFSRAFNRYRAVLTQLQEEGRATDPATLFESTFVDNGNRWRFGPFTEAFLEFANGVQADLNRLLHRADNAPPLVFEDLLRIL